ncbi:MAG: (d)CMP kinase [Synergistaceae bacterium]|jgi:cytidylate kinase|nr:(d)CMP kinase [Synergistaceae bacterium]
MPAEDRAPVIVIDGPAGAGKSTVAREVARRMDLPFLDTGAIYRAITLVLLRDQIPPADSPKLRERVLDFRVSFSDCRVFVGTEDVTEAIRTPEIDRAVSAYSALRTVRESLLDIQRNLAENGLVAEGRDMGTVVFPYADVKIFLTASPEARAGRRYHERVGRGEAVSYDDTLSAVKRRDRMDSERSEAPLRAAEDSMLFDTTCRDFEQVVSRIMDMCRSKLKIPAI